MALPTVFIGSSTEHLPTARALAKVLGGFAKPTVWEDAPFELNASTLDGLLAEAERADFAVFVFDNDDTVRIRNVAVRTVRDNVLFEFGLFTGRMGKGRTFWISAKGSQAPHIPTDLLGVTHLTFAKPRSRETPALVKVLEEPCVRLEAEIGARGRRSDRAVDELDSVKMLCVASSEYNEPRFAADIKQIRENLPLDAIEVAHGVDVDEMLSMFDRPWDIVHLAMYVDSATGDLFVHPAVPGSEKRKVIPLDGVDTLIRMAQPRLVVVVTCDSLVLATRLARHTNVIAGHTKIAAESSIRWSAVFYPALGKGCSLSEAFNRAQALADPGLVLIAKSDFRLNLPSVHSSRQYS